MKNMLKSLGAIQKFHIFFRKTQRRPEDFTKSEKYFLVDFGGAERSDLRILTVIKNFGNIILFTVSLDC